MALVLGDAKSRVIDCVFENPTQERGQKIIVPVGFKVLPTDDWRELLKSSDFLVDAVIDAIVSIDLRNEVGEKLPFDDEARRMLLDTRWTHAGLIDGFMAVQSGLTVDAYKKAKAKN